MTAALQEALARALIKALEDADWEKEAPKELVSPGVGVDQLGAETQTEFLSHWQTPPPGEQTPCQGLW